MKWSSTTHYLIGSALLMWNTGSMSKSLRTDTISNIITLQLTDASTYAEQGLVILLGFQYPHQELAN